MINIHSQLFAIMRDLQKSKNSILAKDIETAKDEELYRRYFINFRKSENNTRGLRLSYEGLVVIREFFDYYEIPLNEGFSIKGKHLIFLDQICTLPFYISSKTFILFEKELAMRAKLVGDLDILISAFEKS